MNIALKTVKKIRRQADNGKEDTVKETQEGCLSRSIKSLFEVQKVRSAWRKDIFDKLRAIFLISPSRVCQKTRRQVDDGKEDIVKETQEGCLSRSVLSLFELS